MLNNHAFVLLLPHKYIRRHAGRTHRGIFPIFMYPRVPRTPFEKNLYPCFRDRDITAEFLLANILFVRGILLAVRSLSDLSSHLASLYIL